MPNARLVSNNFTRGQLSKKMRGRNDLDFYRSGTELQINFDSDVQGSASYRLGSIFLDGTKSNNPAVNYEFVFNEDEAYVLEFTDLFLQFWTADGRVTGAGAELVTPYAFADLKELQITQTADTMYIAHKNYTPRTLTRTGANTFVLAKHLPTDAPWTISDTQPNYPRAVAIYEKRLMYGGSDANPQTIYMSQSFLYDVFSLGTSLDDEGIEYRIGSDRINRINWLSPTSTRCVVGTNGGTFDMASGSSTNPITPSSIQITPSSTKGVELIRPTRRDDTVIYVEAGGRKLNSYQYEFESDNFASIDRTVLSEDIVESGITSLRFASGASDKLLCTLNSGEMAILVWKPEQQVFGWSQRDTDGLYLSVASIPSTQGDRIMACVQREIGGVTKYYMEISAEAYVLPEQQDFFTNDKDTDETNYRLASYEAQKSYVHLDSALTTDGSTRGLSATADLTIPTAAIGDSIQITSSASVFLATDVGNQIRVKSGEGWAKIVAYVSGTEITAIIDTVFDETSYVAGSYYITVDTITGLSHLEGKTVRICKDGADSAPRLVTGGVVTLSDDLKVQGSVVHVGLGYIGVIKTLDLQGGVDFRTEGRYKVAATSNLLLLQTIGTSFGSDVYNLNRLPFQTTGNRTDRPPLPFSGYREVVFNDKNQRSKNMIVLHNTPTPCTIQQIVTELSVS